MQRFPVAVSASVQPKSPDHSAGKEIALISRNVCAGGAFFKTAAPMDVGTKVMVKMFLSRGATASRGSNGTRITVAGTIIRTDADGMAVSFDKNYEISAA